MEYPTLLWLSFLAGLYAPLGSPCVIVLYPGYLAFLAGRGYNDGGAGDGNGRAPASLFVPGVAVAAGVILALLLGGIVFGILLHAFGPVFRAVAQPVVSFLLLVFALVLIFDICVPSAMESLPLQSDPSPLHAALVFGLFLGILILPCNAAVILVLLALATSAGTAAEALGLFLVFGAGMVLPLLLLAGITRVRSRQVLGFLTRHRLTIQRAAGLVMVVIALWYLALVFLTDFS